MTAQVSSSLIRVLSGHMEEQSQIHTGNSDILITKDLLGNLSRATDIDLEFKAGKVEAKKCSSSSSWASPKSPLSTTTATTKGSDSKLQDLNFPPINLFEEMATSLDLKLQSCSSSSTATTTTAAAPSLYQSVCTLDKVKHALERAEKGTVKKRSSSSSLSSSPPQQPPPPSTTAETPSSSTTRMFAAACPGCLLYVIASNTNPRCPRCNSFVPSSSPTPPPPLKKPRIDLNVSF